MTGSDSIIAPESPAFIPLDDVTDLEALPPSRMEQPATTVNTVTSSPKLEPLLALHSQPTLTDLPHGSDGQPETSQQVAKYVTVSAILSRSGVIYPMVPHSEAHDDLFSLDHHSRGQSNDAPPSTLRRRRRTKGTTSGAVFSSGNALEAIGALWLSRDVKGSATTLSSQRWFAGNKDDQGSSTHPNAGYTAGLISSYRAFLNAVKGLATSMLGLHRQDVTYPSSIRNTGSETITERRQKMMYHHTGDVVGTEGNTVFVRIKTRKDQPTFDVGQSIPPSPKLKKTFKSSVSDPVPDPRTAFRRVRSSPYPSTYGFGSSCGPQHPLDAPPSPVGMPGDWPGGKDWSSLAVDGHEDAPLLLPPPFLDDHGSNPQSFEGLLGVKRIQQQQAAQKRLQQLALWVLIASWMR